MRINYAEIKQLSIVDWLIRLGHQPVRNVRDYALFHAPYREDKHPSMKVSKAKNRWYDFATMESGDIIDLGRKVYATNNDMEVIDHLQHLTPIPLTNYQHPAFTKKGEHMGHFRNVVAQPLQHGALLSYLDSRKVDVDIAKKYCHEVYFSLGAKRYFALGFENVRGGFEIRNQYFKACIAPKDVSVVSPLPHNKDCYLFEGFIDFLSFLTKWKQAKFVSFSPYFDYVVLNSVSNLHKAVPWLDKYQTVTCCLDNDDAGRRAVDALSELREGIHDASGAYEGYKDLNDMLRDRRYCP